MIIDKCEGRLGNKLFQYCFGKILATELNCNFKVDAIPGFPNATPIRNTWFPTLTLRKQILALQPVDLDSIIRNKQRRQIILCGYFQRYEYYRPYKEEIKNDWLFMPNRYGCEDEDITIHIRVGDVWAKNCNKPPHVGYPGLPFSYYKNILDSRGWNKIHIVTDDKEDLMVNKIADVYGASVHRRNKLDDFNFIKSSRNIVLAVSTFGWWAAWLSDAKRIYFPLCGVWHPDFRLDNELRNDIDTMVDDEGRYFYCDLGAKSWKGSEEDRIRLLST